MILADAQEAHQRRFARLFRQIRDDPRTGRPTAAPGIVVAGRRRRRRHQPADTQRQSISIIYYLINH